jgi:hypothetical protein
MKLHQNGALPTNLHARYIVMGPSGAGKSTLGATMPGPVAVIATEPNAALPLRRSFEEVERVYIPEGVKDRIPHLFFEVENVGDVHEAIAYLEKNIAKLGIRSIVIDSLSSLAEWTFYDCFNAINEKRVAYPNPKPALEGPDVQTYGHMYAKIDNLRTRIHRLPANVLWLAGYNPPTYDRDGNLEAVGAPMLPGGKMRLTFPLHVQGCLHLRAKVNVDYSTTHYLTCGPDNNGGAKDNTGSLPLRCPPDMYYVMAKSGVLPPSTANAVLKAYADKRKKE